MIQNMLKHKIEKHAIISNFILFNNILITCYTRTNRHTHTYFSYFRTVIPHTRHMNTPY